ncbi:MAG: hypothetical protein M3M96_01875 [Candidatus Eremiobacteraeota bacterium]|nr:hypothetical protein [Candidatus Eremiobacteraeota bacterium]
MLLTVTLTEALRLLESVTVMVAVPTSTGATVNVAVGPFACNGLTVATPRLLLVAVSVPL